MLRSAFSLFALLFLVTHAGYYVLAWPNLLVLQSLGAAGMLLTGLPVSRRSSQLFCLLIGGSGIALLAFHGAKATAYLESLRTLNDILALITTVHVLVFLLQIREYAPHLIRLLRPHIQNLSQVSIWSSVLTHVIGAAGSLTGILVVFEMLRPGVIGQEPDSLSNPDLEPIVRRFASGIARGYAMTILWAPSSVPFAVATHFTGAPLLTVMVPGMLLALLGLAIHAIIEKRKHQTVDVMFAWRDDLQAAALLDEESKDTESKKRVQEFLVVLAAIIVGIVLLNQCTALSLLQTVPIVVLATTFVVLVGKRQYDELIRMGARFVREALPSKHQEVILLTASGILVSALNQTGTGLTLFESFTEYVSHLPISLPTGIAIAILLLGFAGIPPLATTILVAATIDRVIIAQAPALISLSIASGICTGTLLSPNSVPLLVLSGLIRRSPFEAGLRWNWPYALGLFGLTLCFIEIAWHLL